MKRTLSVILAMVMVLGIFGTVFAQDAHWMSTTGAGDFLAQKGVLEGDDDGNLMLNKTLLRRDMVVLLSRLMKAESTAKNFSSGNLTFEDITDPYYNGYIAWSVSNNLIEGHTSKTFGFNENVTAQQYVTVLMRALGYEVDDLAYNTILNTAESLDLLKGLDLENNDEITRGQMALLTFNALGTKMKDSSITLAAKLNIQMPQEPAADPVDNAKALIAGLPKAEDVELADKDDIQEAYDAYDLLTPAQKNELTVAESNKLDEVIDKFEELEVKDALDDLNLTVLNPDQATSLISLQSGYTWGQSGSHQGYITIAGNIATITRHASLSRNTELYAETTVTTTFTESTETVRKTFDITIPASGGNDVEVDNSQEPVIQ